MEEVLEKYFPDDENGNVLKNMASAGDDLTKPRDVDFSVIFREEHKANKFCDLVKQNVPNSMTILSLGRNNNFDVTVTINMVPSYNGISSIEKCLFDLSFPLGGENDGWGCFSVDIE